MGRKYYYFAATLPMPDFERPAAALAVEDFLSAADGQLALGDIRLLRSALDGIPVPSGQVFLAAWQTFERYLKNAIGSARMLAQDRHPQSGPHGDKGADVSMSQAVEEAVKHPDPLEGEKILDRLRWQQLDQMALGHYFDLEFLIAYALKLKILQRYRVIATGQGREMFATYRGQLIREKMSNIHQGEWRE